MPKQYEVQKILERRTQQKKNKCEVQYLVKWKGYSEEESTWEPENNLTTCRQMVEQFNRKNKGKAVNGKNNFDSPVEESRPIQKQLSSYSSRKYQADEDQEEKKFEQKQEQNNTIKQYMKQTARKSNRLNPKLKSKEDQQEIEIEDDNKEQREEIDEQFGEELFEPMKKKNGLGKQNEAKKTNLTVIGMFKNDSIKQGEYFFKVKGSEGDEIIPRNQLIDRDPVAMIRFYEQHMKFVSQ